VRSPELPDGAFLGEGAALHAGQWIELPRGTRVELLLAGGQRLRLDEDSELRLPDRADQADQADQAAQVELRRGRLVVLASDDQRVEVLAADDRLVIERGEVELHHAGETRHFGVVQGRAILHTAGREIPLGPGASISTPAAPTTRPETPPDETLLAAALIPTLSLAPLHATAWTAAFEESARLADDVPQGVGSLVAKRAGSSVERQSLRLTEQTVKVTISGRIARTEIEQAFHNDSSQTLEGIYQFPLPSDASISDLQLLVGDTWMRGEMLEKRRARQIFRQIVDATVPRDPALLQWEQGSVFKLNIFPIPGKRERRVKIAYTQVLPAVGDSLRYRYPMGGSGATATEIGDFQFDVTVAGLSTGAQVSTPMAELARSVVGEDLQLSMRERDYQPSHELGVDIPLADQGSRRVLAATHRDRDGQGYFMLTLRPDLALREQRRPVHYAFVLDRSHGTSAELWAAAEGMTRAMLSTLEPDDRFTVLACDSACDQLGGGLRSAGPQADSAELDRFLRTQVRAGASDIGNMLTRGADSLAARHDPTDAEVERVIVYMGDGVPTSGALTPDELGALAREQLSNVRIQTVALGARSDLLVLDNLVRQSGGDLIQADARDDLETIARELRLRASVPVARDLAIELPPGLTEVYPKAIPALRPGESLTLIGKLADGDPSRLRGDVRLHGRSRAGAVDERFQVMLDAEYSGAGKAAVHAHLPRTWAQQEITHLTQAEGAAASERIVALSREYNVLSRFTALLVLENDRMYREFNVARKAQDKDAWTGEAEASSSTVAPVAPAPAPMPDEPPPPRQLREDQPADQFDGDELDQETFGGFDALAPAPAPAPAGPSSWEELEAFSGQGIGGGGTSSFSGATKGSGSGRGSQPKPSDDRWAPAPAPTKTKEPAKPSAGGWSGINDGAGDWNSPGRRWMAPRLVVRNASGPSLADSRVIEGLRRNRDADPSNRAAHSALVRRAIRDGHADVLGFTAAWAKADPDHAPALLAHADQLAATGDPLALRAYASAVEVEPFSASMHRRMAEALSFAGDFERACSHHRALVSIDPKNTDDAIGLIECLVVAGRIDEARAALSEARRQAAQGSSKSSKALSKVESVFARGVKPRSSALHSNADLRAELRWTADENLDIAFVDRRGQRLSVLRPQGVRVREQREGSERVEIMTLRSVQGTMFIEVTRPDSNREDPIRATLTVKTPDGTQKWTVELEPGTQRVASIRKQ